jgi:PKD repeat protein
VVSLLWANSAEGAHIIQVVTKPPFPQFTWNDEATRSIFVGDPIPLDISKAFILLVDADGDGRVSPGDTLKYTLTFGNSGDTDVTGAVIIDDFAERWLETPFNISDGGAISAGTITWNIGPLAAGASGSVTYEVNLKPTADFPGGTTIVANIALLTADQTAPVATTHEVPVVANLPPNVETGPDQTVNEGDVVNLAPAAFTDFNVQDTHTATINWGDGAPPEPGSVSEGGGSGVVSGAHVYADDGIYTVEVCVADNYLAVACDALTVTVNNVAPSNIGLSLDPAVIEENGTVILSGRFDDPGTLDQHTVVINWGDGSSDTLMLPLGERAFSASHTYLDDDPSGTPSDEYTINVSVSDDDGGSASNSATVTVNNVNPIIGPITAPVDPTQVNVAITANAVFTDPGLLDIHTAVWDWGDGSDPTVVEITDGARSASDSHTYADPGLYTVRLTVTDDDGGQATGSTTVTVRPTSLAVDQDSFLRSGDSNTNEGANLNMVVRSSGKNRALVSFDLSALPGSVSQATLRLYIVHNANNWGDEGRTIDAHRVLEDWAEGDGANLQPGNLSQADFKPFQNRGDGTGVTWQCPVDAEIHNQKADCDPNWDGGAFEPTPADTVTIYKDFGGNNDLPPTTKTVGWIAFDVTDDVNVCLSNGAEQCSWLIKKTQEGQNGLVEFATQEGALAGYNDLYGEAVSPRLELTYQD